jgi:hypothetical protein
MIEFSDTPASRVGALLECIAERYPACRTPGIDVPGAIRELNRYKALGLVTVTAPAYKVTTEERRKVSAKRKAILAEAAQRAIIEEAKLDRVVSELRSMGNRLAADIKTIAQERGVDYRRLLHRLRGQTKKSRL